MSVLYWGFLQENPESAGQYVCFLCVSVLNSVLFKALNFCFRRAVVLRNTKWCKIIFFYVLIPVCSGNLYTFVREKLNSVQSGSALYFLQKHGLISEGYASFL